ncbi:hypothetical protein P3X46_001631 [Hevea brasiliensis]|uniref:Endonuclease/exonuclease/phosphatase domain-containing protein n=1 Tax=Hevea brasiliensis TaxID=3981 RepID=A0ABQ9ND67_HEVBR|nr:hypothetical protein P3X46_001631 [Hevea brasiliensis]
METKKKKKYLESVRRKLGFTNEFYVDPCGLSWGLALWWTEETQISVLNACPNFIDCDTVLTGQNMNWRTTFVYGWPAIRDKNAFWEDMKLLLSPYPKPWVCVGDFNAISFPDEKIGGDVVRPSQVNCLLNFLKQCDLVDLECKGPFFTWFNKQFGWRAIQERLDRAIAFIEWRELFTKAVVVHEALLGSDHRPLVLYIEWYVYSSPITEANKEVEQSLLNRLHELWQREEIHWKQRSRINWLKEGDKNTRFFHLSTIQRRQRNTILKLRGENGRWLDSDTDIKDEIFLFFKKLY